MFANHFPGSLIEFMAISLVNILPKAIERFVASSLGLMGSSPVEAAQIDQLGETVRDIKALRVGSVPGSFSGPFKGDLDRQVAVVVFCSHCCRCLG